MSTDDDAARSRADRVFVTAHPAEPAASVALRAGEAVLESYLDDVPGDLDSGPLRLLFHRYLAERLPDDPDGELLSAVTAAAVVAALDLALAQWRASGARADGVPACRERFRAVAPLLPPEPGRTAGDPRGRRPSAVDTAAGRPSRRLPLP